MDPLTHGLLGAAAAYAATGKRTGRRALLAGALAGMAPDLDVVAEFASDPTLGLELHRHFTHSLAFIPLGALLVALILRIFKKYRGGWGGVYAACLCGYATHAPIDACTSYGTMLLWPFSDARLSWDSVSIVDPFITFPLLLAVILAAATSRARWTIGALAFCLVYLVFGEAQNRRALSEQARLAESRGHDVVQARAMPTLGNSVVFRSVYAADGKLWADAIRVVPWGGIRTTEGSSVPLFTESELPPGFLERSDLVREWRIFRWFADDLVARTERPDVLGDMRYSAETNGFKPLWGMGIPSDPGSARHVEKVYFRENRRSALRRIVPPPSPMPRPTGSCSRPANP